MSSQSDSSTFDGGPAAKKKKRHGHDRHDRHHRRLLKPSTVLQLMSARTLARTSTRKGRRLWGKLIYDRMLGMVHGPRGGGKTFFMLSLAISIAAGLKYLGQGPGTKCKVVMLDGEMGFRLMRERLKVVSAALGTKPPSNLLLLNPDLFDGLLPSLATEEGQAAIEAALPEDVDLIIVDNFSCWNRGGREDADGWGIWNSWLLDQKRRGRTVILVHHTGKSGDQRGTSKREDSLDFVIALKPRVDPERPGDLGFDLEWTKSRHLTRSAALPIRAALRAEEDGLTWTFDRPPSVADRTALARQLSAENLNQTEIAERLGVNKSTVSRMLRGGDGK
jgi:hypothetical protein